MNEIVILKSKSVDSIKGEPAKTGMVCRINAGRIGYYDKFRYEMRIYQSDYPRKDFLDQVKKITKFEAGK